MQKPPVAWSTANAALLGAYASAELVSLRERILAACGLILESADQSGEES